MCSASNRLLTPMSVMESGLRLTRAAARAMRSRSSATFSAIDMRGIIEKNRRHRRDREKQNLTTETRRKQKRLTTDQNLLSPISENPCHQCLSVVRFCFSIFNFGNSGDFGNLFCVSVMKVIFLSQIYIHHIG